MTYVRFLSFANRGNEIEPVWWMVRRTDIRRVRELGELVQFVFTDREGGAVIATNDAVCRAASRPAWRFQVDVIPSDDELQRGLVEAKAILDRSKQERALQPPSASSSTASRSSRCRELARDRRVVRRLPEDRKREGDPTRTGGQEVDAHHVRAVTLRTYDQPDDRQKGRQDVIEIEISEAELERLAEDAIRDIYGLVYGSYNFADGDVGPGDEQWSAEGLAEFQGEVNTAFHRAITLVRKLEAVRAGS